MSKDKEIYWEHLVSNIPNTEDNRKSIKEINKKAKESKSRWHLLIKYRKPKPRFKYGSGGSLRCENANAFSVYIKDRREYCDQPEVKERSRLWDKIRELEAPDKINRHQRWIHLAQAVDSWRIFPRMFLTVYIVLLYKCTIWFMALETPSFEQSGLISIVVGAGAAWFGLYAGTTNSSKTFK